MPKPSFPPPRWADVSGVNRTAIDPGLRDVGFPPGAIVPAGENNQRDYEAGEWLRYLQGALSEDAHQFLVLPAMFQYPTAGATVAKIPGPAVDLSFAGNDSVQFIQNGVLLVDQPGARMRLQWAFKAGSENIAVLWSLLRPAGPINPFGSIPVGDLQTFAISASNGTRDDLIDQTLPAGLYLLQIRFQVTGSTGVNSLDNVRVGLTYGPTS